MTPTLDRPAWVLRPGGKVEPAAPRGRAEDATHWCREGDARWTPLCPPRPPPPFVAAEDARIYP